MTETPRQPGRIDLRALDDPPDPSQPDRVIRAALDRHAASGTRWLAAAAVLLLVATGAQLLAPRDGPAPPAAVAIAEWVAADRLPSNGDLLTAFHGYAP